MKVIAVYSSKGGVGKTTTCVNLAYCAAQQQQVSLLWDLDPQGAATFYYQLKSKVKGGAEKLFAKKSHLLNYVKETQYPNLDVLPADLSYRQLDLLLGEMKKSEKRFKVLLRELRTEYAYVFIDCPPTLNLLAGHIFEVADYVLFPTVPTTLSERAFGQVERFFKDRGHNRQKLIPFFSMVDRRKKLHRDTVACFGATHPQTLRTAIPNSAVIERMGVNQAPVQAYSRQSAPSKAYQDLWRELQGMVLA